MKKYFQILLILIPQFVLGQNLLKDGDFEVFDKCPNTITVFPKDLQLTYWYSINAATPDYFNSCCKNNNASIPKNSGGNQDSKSGEGYVRIIANENYFEYVRTELEFELIKGSEYYLEFWVCRQEKFMKSSNCIGAMIGKSNHLEKITTKEIKIIPQIQSKEFITDKDNWTKISGTFKASGGEKYLTLGYFPYFIIGGGFKTDKFIITPGAGFAGYYIDAVKLIQVNDM